MSGVMLLPHIGNTPTGVGKTLELAKEDLILGKHPHGRGEDSLAARATSHCFETPPRAWGRLLPLVVLLVPLGNTPTGVGKTRVWTLRLMLERKHPHGRGEDCFW